MMKTIKFKLAIQKILLEVKEWYKEIQFGIDNYLGIKVIPNNYQIHRLTAEQLLKYKERMENEVKNSRSQLAILIKEAKEKRKIEYYEDLVNKSDLLGLLEKREEQLVYLKVSQQAVNLQNLHGDEINSYYVFKLSNLKERRKAIEPLLSDKDISSLTNKERFIKANVDFLTTLITEIEGKLTRFNSTKKVKVYINPELLLTV